MNTVTIYSSHAQMSIKIVVSCISVIFLTCFIFVHNFYCVCIFVFKEGNSVVQRIV